MVQNLPWPDVSLKQSRVGTSPQDPSVRSVVHPPTPYSCPGWPLPAWVPTTPAQSGWRTPNLGDLHLIEVLEMLLNL